MCWYRYNRMKVYKEECEEKQDAECSPQYELFDCKNAKKLDGFWCLVSGSMGNEFLICFNFNAHWIQPPFKSKSPKFWANNRWKKNTLHLCVYLNGFKMCKSLTLDYLKTTETHVICWVEIKHITTCSHTHNHIPCSVYMRAYALRSCVGTYGHSAELVSAVTRATDTAELYILIPSPGSLADRAPSTGSERQTQSWSHNTRRNEFTGLEVGGVSSGLTAETVHGIMVWKRHFKMSSNLGQEWHSVQFYDH